MAVELGTVTLVAVDQVGSTEQLRTLGDTAGQAVRAELLDQLLLVVDQHRGTLVDTTGDGLLAHFPGAALALSASKGCMELSSRFGRGGDASQRCQLRIGVHTGDPLVDGSGRLHGMAVVVATRLCAAASPDDILVSGLTRSLVANRPEFEFDAEVALQLKGVGDPVPAVLLSWALPQESDAESTPHLPALDETFPFVGRSGELALCTAALASMEAGDRQVLALSGEPGVGKTRLASEVLRRAVGTGATVGVGVCDEDVQGPYQPVIDALNDVLGQRPPEDVAALLTRHPHAASILRPRTGDDTAQQLLERHVFFADLARLLVELTMPGPICLLLDDLQWATVDTLSMIRYLVRETAKARLLLLFTYRNSDITQEHPLFPVIADLHRLPGTTQVRLDGLDSADVVQLAAAAAGHPLGEQEERLARLIHAETAGSPFFATELILHLVESGHVVNVDGRWTLASPDALTRLPASVRDVVLRRVGRLSPVTQELLRVAATIGQTFDLEVLAATVQTDELSVLDSLEDAVEAGLVEELGADRFEFRHRLTRTSLYEQLSASRRARYHRRVGEAMEALRSSWSGRVEELAYHWSEATSLSDPRRVARYCSLGGDEARRRGAPEDARRLYERALLALDLVADPQHVDRVDLLIKLGEVLRGLGDGQARPVLDEAAAAARSLGDQDRLARAVHGMLRAGLFFTEGGVEDTALVALIDEALPTAAGAARARLLAARAAERHWTATPRELELEADEALVMARAAGDRRVLAEVLLARCVALGGPDHTVQRIEWAAEALEIAHEEGSAELELPARLVSICARYELCDVRCLVDLEALYALTESVTDKFAVWMVRVLQATRAIMIDPADGESKAVAAYQMAESINQPDAFAAFAVQIADVLWHTGRLAEFVDAYREAAYERPVIGFRSGYARVLVELERWDEAAAELAWLDEAGFDAPHDIIWLGAVSDTGMVVARLGSDDQRRRLYDLLLPFAGRLAFSVWFLACNGTIDRVLGLLAHALGDDDAARRHLHDARRIDEAFGHRVWTARSDEDLSRLLPDRSDVRQ